jgi:hypothetical protein
MYMAGYLPFIEKPDGTVIHNIEACGIWQDGVWEDGEFHRSPKRARLIGSEDSSMESKNE